MAKETRDRTAEAYNYILENCLPVIANHITQGWTDRGRAESIEVTGQSIICWRLLAASNTVYSSWSPPQNVPGTESAMRLFAYVQPIINNISVGASVQIDIDLTTAERKIKITGWEDLVDAYNMITRQTCETGDPIQPAIINAEARERDYQANLPKVQQLILSWGFEKSEVDILINRLRNLHPTLSTREFEKLVIREVLKIRETLPENPENQERKPNGKPD